MNAMRWFECVRPNNLIGALITPDSDMRFFSLESYRGIAMGHQVYSLQLEVHSGGIRFLGFS
jgi:hypothetical protein